MSPLPWHERDESMSRGLNRLSDQVFRDLLPRVGAPTFGTMQTMQTAADLPTGWLADLAHGLEPKEDQ